jgi:hypothetical protein
MSAIIGNLSLFRALRDHPTNGWSQAPRPTNATSTRAR